MMDIAMMDNDNIRAYVIKGTIIDKEVRPRIDFILIRYR